MTFLPFPLPSSLIYVFPHLISANIIFCGQQPESSTTRDAASTKHRQGTHSVYVALQQFPRSFSGTSVRNTTIDKGNDLKITVF